MSQSNTSYDNLLSSRVELQVINTVLGAMSRKFFIDL